MFGIFSQVQGWVRIKGNTDGTKIGNVSDSLKTNVTASVLPTGASTESTLSTLSGKLNPLTNDPSISASGIVVRPIPYKPATFNLSAVTIPLGNNKSMLALLNPTGSTVILKLQYLKIINNQTTGVTGVAADFRIRRITGLSAGTAVVPQAFDTNDTLGAGIIAAHNGTVAGEFATDLMRYVWSSDEWGTGASDVELKVKDTAAGTYSTVPNMVLDAFGITVNIAKDYWKGRSEYDADIYVGMVLEFTVNNTSNITKVVGVNMVFHEVTTP